MKKPNDAETNLDEKERMNQVQETESIQEKQKKNPKLGIIFDIDGTLIAENDNIFHVLIRPGTVEFLKWCKYERGYSLALWTTAGESWAKEVCKKLCPLVTSEKEESINKDLKGGDGNNKIYSLFDFVWTSNRMVKRKTIPISSISGEGKCRWCEVYSKNCGQCACDLMGIYYCPCREVKDLRKVWYSSDIETQNFRKENTLLVENTPQNCIFNYGNAIYVPTYTGNRDFEEKEVLLYDRFKRFIERELDHCVDVRFVRKCNHTKAYHACYDQKWWYD